MAATKGLVASNRRDLHAEKQGRRSQRLSSRWGRWTGDRMTRNERVQKRPSGKRLGDAEEHGAAGAEKNGKCLEIHAGRSGNAPLGHALCPGTNGVMKDDDGEREGKLCVKPRHVGVHSGRQRDAADPGAKAQEKRRNRKAHVHATGEATDLGRLGRPRSMGHEDGHREERPNPHDVPENVRGKEGGSEAEPGHGDRLMPLAIGFTRDPLWTTR